MKKAISILCAAALLFSAAYSRAFEAEAYDYTGEWVSVAVDLGDGVLKKEYERAKVEDEALLLIHRDGTLSAVFGGTEQGGTWEKMEGGVRVTIDGQSQSALDFLLKDGRLVVKNGAGETFYLSRTEEGSGTRAESTRFPFFRNGITWASTPEQVREAEGIGQEKEYRVNQKYPGFQLLEIQNADNAQLRGNSLNYLFYNNSLLAFFNDSRGQYYGLADRDSLVSSMSRQYGEPMPAGSDWVTQTLKNVPVKVLTHFELEDGEHNTWMINEDTAAFIITYNQGGNFALVYVNLGLVADMGFNADGAGDTFFLRLAEESPAQTEEGTSGTEGTKFTFSRNGITWAAAPEQVRRVEGVSRDNDYWVHRDYTDFKLLNISNEVTAVVQASSLNYVFYKYSLLAIFYDFVSWESGNAAKRDSLLAAMTRKYGRPMTVDTDWVTENLKSVPGEVLTALYIEDVEHQTWMIHEDTAAFLITYNRRGGFALVYVNRGLLAELGFSQDGQVSPDWRVSPDGI